jgi:hypothetical protein
MPTLSACFSICLLAASAASALEPKKFDDPLFKPKPTQSPKQFDDPAFKPQPIKPIKPRVNPEQFDDPLFVPKEPLHKP